MMSGGDRPDGACGHDVLNGGLLRDSTPIIQHSLRPFARAALPTVRDLRPASADLAAATPPRYEEGCPIFRRR